MVNGHKNWIRELVWLMDNGYKNWKMDNNWILGLDIEYLDMVFVGFNKM